jgi:hypothetical protein
MSRFSESFRRLSALALLLCQLAVATGVPVLYGVSVFANGSADGIVCNCIHDPGTTCPMHPQKSTSRPSPQSEATWQGCGPSQDAALLAVVTLVGVPETSHVVVAPPELSLVGPDGGAVLHPIDLLPSVPPPKV